MWFPRLTAYIFGIVFAGKFIVLPQTQMALDILFSNEVTKKSYHFFPPGSPGGRLWQVSLIPRR